MPVANHAFINIQSDLAMIIGGELDVISSEKTFYFNHTNKKWSEGPELNHDRFNHAVGIVTDEATQEKLVIVTGGWNGYIVLKSTEVLLAGTWSIGEK